MYRIIFLILMTVILGCESNVVNQKNQKINYIEKIDLPDCKIVNSETFIIDSLDDWKHINDLNKTIFCVKPGDYSSLGKIAIKTDGTALKKRYIILDNGDTFHPARTEKKRLAKVAFELEGADYWVFDRLAYWDRNDAFIPFVFSNSNFNIVNRYFVENVNGGAIVFYPNSNNNTVQNSRIERSDVFSYIDRGAIELNNHGEDNISIKNNKILNNEIVNAVDGIQLVKTGKSTQKNINYEGTIIDNNHIYITNKIYTDCNGTLKLDGDCAYAENAIDLKSGSENSTNPIIISNNKMWGFRQADTVDYTRLTKKNYLSDLGVVVPFHFNIKNVLMKNNLFFNSTLGVVMDGTRDGFTAQDITFEDNIFCNIRSSAIYATYVNGFFLENNLFYKIANGSDGKGKDVYNSLYFNNSKRIKFYDNKIVQSNKLTKFYVRSIDYNGNEKEYYEFKNNIYIEADFDRNNNDYEKSITVVDKNATVQKWLDSNIVDDKNLTFITDKFLAKSRKITIPRVLN